jgi:hypothetical protein
MRLKFRKRPSAGVVIGVIALVLALGGTAIAGSKIHFGDLGKDTKQKVLPYGATTAITTPCDPTDAATFKECATATLSVSKAYPRRAMVVVDGTFTTGPAGGRGTCRLQVDGQPQGTAVARLGAAAGAHEGQHGDGFGMNAIVQPLTGSHRYALACNETEGNIEIDDAYMTVITLRG